MAKNEKDACCSLAAAAASRREVGTSLSLKVGLDTVDWMVGVLLLFFYASPPNTKM